MGGSATNQYQQPISCHGTREVWTPRNSSTKTLHSTFFPQHKGQHSRHLQPTVCNNNSNPACQLAYANTVATAYAISISKNAEEFHKKTLLDAIQGPSLPSQFVPSSHYQLPPHQEQNLRGSMQVHIQYFTKLVQLTIQQRQYNTRQHSPIELQWQV